MEWCLRDRRERSVAPARGVVEEGRVVREGMQRLSDGVPMLMSYILSQPPPFFRYLVELLVVSPLASGFGHDKAE